MTRPSFLFLALWLGIDAQAQDQRFFPLDHNQRPGVAGRWAVLTQPRLQNHMQPVRIDIEGGATVSYYHGSPQNEVAGVAPTQAKMQVGRVYRVKLANLKNQKDVELYPTLEILDRLHPPDGHADQFPIPIQITAEEIEIASRDQLVTKVIYLEQPQFASPLSTTPGRMLTDDLEPNDNLLQAADLRGRPMAILRMGGRVPDPSSSVDEFYSDSPLEVTGVFEVEDLEPEEVKEPYSPK